eukprot:917066-Pelagomonas_calceolata.AAC.9
MCDPTISIVGAISKLLHISLQKQHFFQKRWQDARPSGSNKLESLEEKCTHKEVDLKALKGSMQLVTLLQREEESEEEDDEEEEEENEGSWRKCRQSGEV